jgi:MFS transporter, OFA family, oxalate/formate antiporter
LKPVSKMLLAPQSGGDLKEFLETGSAKMANTQSHRNWILFALFWILFCTLGSIVNTIPIFITPLMKHYGWTHTQASALPMAYSLTMGLGAPLVGWALDRIEARVVMAVGVLVLASGLFMAGAAHSFLLIFAGHLLIGAGTAASSIVPGSFVAANWFGERRGFAIGVTIAGGSLGGVIMPPIVDRLIGLSIATAYFTLAVMVLVVPISLILAIIQTRPATLGPDTRGDFDDIPGLELRPALRTRQFWILVAVQVLASLGMFGTFFYTVPFLIQSGYASSKAALALSVVNAAAGVGLLIMGALCDRFTGRRVLPFITIQLGLSSLLLLGAGSASGGIFYLVAFLLIFGLVVGFATIVPVVLVEIFGLKRFGTLSGLLGMASALAMANGPMVVGVIFDTTNSYTIAFEVSAILCFLAAASGFALSPIEGSGSVSPEAVRVSSRH